MRSILLHIADDAGLAARTQVALDLARAFDGHVTCLQPLAYPYPIPGDFYGMAYAEFLKASRETAEKLREQCEARLASEDVSWSWDAQDQMTIDALLIASQLSDVVVVGSRAPVGDMSSWIARELVGRVRAPMFLVPDETTRLECSGPALVAWDGSAEASRALVAATPLLAKARSVVLATVLGEEDKTFDLPAVEGAEYLSRHGVECELVEFQRGSRSVADVLTEVAAHREVEYLVMGAYGHARLVEAILGGVTKSLFANAPLPLLACH